MARRRTQWPEFWTSEEMLSLSKDEHRAYGSLISEADDGGRVSLSPVLLKSRAFSVYADTVADCKGYIDALVSAGHVAAYDVDGKRYGLILGFSAHQKPNADKVRPGGSWCPPPPGDIAIGCADYCYGAQRILETTTKQRPKQIAEMAAILWPYGCDIPSTRLADVRHVEFTGLERGYHVDTTWMPDSCTADSADTADSDLEQVSSPSGTRAPSAPAEPAPARSAQVPVKRIVASWNSRMEHVNVPQCRSYESIRQNVGARWKQAGATDDEREATFRDVFERVARSSFLTGQTDKPFRASLAWLVKLANWEKVCNGQFDDAGADHRTGPKFAPSPAAQRLRELELEAGGAS